MKSPNNEVVDEVSTGNLLSPNEVSSIGKELHPVELLAKRVSWKSPNNKTVAKTVCCSQQTESRTPLLKTIPTKLTEH